MPIKPTKYLRKLAAKKKWMTAKLKVKPTEPYTSLGDTVAIAVITERGSVVMARLTDQNEVSLFCDNSWAGKAVWENSEIADCNVVFDSDAETRLVLHLLTMQLRTEISAQAALERERKRL